MTEKEILETLQNVRDPESGKDIVSNNQVKILGIDGKKLTLKVLMASPSDIHRRKLDEDVRFALHAIGGIGEIDLRIEAQVSQSPSLANSPRLTTVKNVIAVASGKGGVGKSTVAANLAVALHQLGAKVGILDSDIYGPSMPTLFGLKGVQPMVHPSKQKLLPLERFGLKIMSIGFMTKETDAVIWRGPMIHKLLQQFMEDVEWGEIDYLVVDLPPGTGDTQLSLSQLIPITGSVIVTTPQDVALADVVRGVTMFQKVGVPVLGVIENMSYFECPHCTKKSEIFSHGGGKKKAEEMNAPFLGELPLDLPTRIGSDEGKPITASDPDAAQSVRFREMAQKIVHELNRLGEASIKVEI